MLFAVDIGNTNIVLGCMDGDKIVFSERISTNTSAVETEYAVIIKNILEINSVKFTDIHNAIICSVVPVLTEILQKAVRKILRTDAMIVNSSLKTGFDICIDNPKQLGADRIADAVGACRIYGSPVIIIDMGTATTISVIDKNKKYLGGLILPGLVTSVKALAKNTAKLPEINLGGTAGVIGTNTADSIRNGIILSHACAIDGIVSRIEKQFGYSCTVVSTGGLAEKVVPLCERKIVTDSDLLMKGLSVIYELNKNNQDN